MELSSETFPTIEEGIAWLGRVRSKVYEDLNQIPHEFAILSSAEWLVGTNRFSPDTIWYWNARQTGDAKEPDLRGVRENQIVISAEVTTSPIPKGFIDSRMKTTLAKLSNMPGKKFYFITTDAMLVRATTKIKKGGWDIEPIRLSSSS